MGAASSTPTRAAPSEDTPKMTVEEMQLQQIVAQSMPTYVRPETFEQKLYRKVSLSLLFMLV